MLLAALTCGLTIIWLTSIAGAGRDPRMASWFQGNIGAVGEHFLSAIYTLWLCVAVHRGRRWGFVALAFQNLRQALQGALSSELTYVAAYSVALAYCVLRLWTPIGPKLPKSSPIPSFLSDKVAAITLAVLDVGTTLSFLFAPPPGQVVTASYVLWFILLLPELLWFQLSAYRSRGWAMGIGLLFTLMGFVVQIDHPEQRLQRAEATAGFLYFGLRLATLGPRPKGFLGLDSE